MNRLRTGFLIARIVRVVVVASPDLQLSEKIVQHLIYLSKSICSRIGTRLA